MKAIFSMAILLLAASSSFSAVKTWDGGGADANWQTAANWVGDTAPIAGDDLVFPAAATQFTANNNFFILTGFRSILIEGGSYTLGGSPIRLTAGLTVNGGTQTVNVPITLSAAQTFAAADTATATIAILSVGSFGLTFDGGGITGIGLISGTGAITKNGPGGAGVIAASGYSGSITVNNGVFVVDANIPGSAVTVNTTPAPGGVLGFSGFGGTGTVGATSVTQGIISSGTITSPTGILNINGGLTVSSLGAYACKIGGSVPGANGHDQLNVVGAVNLNNAALVPVPLNGFVPNFGEKLLILKNDGTDPINGTFLGLPDGSVFRGPGNQAFRISYHGGDGNDVDITRINITVADFDGDGTSDLSIYRPSEGRWYLAPASGIVTYHWGVADDQIAPGDFDGDGKADASIFRPSTSTWYIIGSRNLGLIIFVWGVPGDIPVPADYDGDLISDPAVFRPSNNTWYIRGSRDGFRTQTFGAAGDIAVPADYDGDGRVDVAVFRGGTWYVSQSGSGGAMSVRVHGLASDVPVAADYDGDGIADLAVYRPSEGGWYIVRSRDALPQFYHWGIATDVPVPGDYDGDGMADVGVYRNGAWYVIGTSAGIIIRNWGVSGDAAVPAAY